MIAEIAAAAAAEIHNTASGQPPAERFSAIARIVARTLTAALEEQKERLTRPSDN